MLTRHPGKVTMALIIGITIAAGLPVFLLMALFTEVSRDLGAPPWVLGVIVAAYWTVAAVLSVAGGTLTTRFGGRIVVLLTLVTAFVSLVGFAAFVPTWPWLFLWAVIGGVAGGTAQPPMNQMLTLRVALARHPFAFGLKQAAVPLATLLCGLAIPLVALTLGWRWAFAFAALATISLVPVFLQLGPRRIASGSGGRLARAVGLSRDGTRFFTMLAAVNAFAVGGISMVVSYGVVSAVDRGIEPGLAGFLLSGASVAGALMRISAGILASNVRRDALRMTAIMQVVGAIGIVIMVPDNQVTYGIGIIVAFAIGWGWTGLIHYSVSQIAGPATPAATGIVQTGSYIGSGAGPLLAGIIYTAWGGHWLWMAAAIMLGGSGIAAYRAARRPRPETPLPIDPAI